MKYILLRWLSNRFYLVFITLTFWVNIQWIHAQQQPEAKPQMDTLSVLNDGLRIALINGTFQRMGTRELVKMYSASFGIEKIIYSDGFRIHENTLLRFYQTSIPRPVIDDGGLATWKTIELYTSKIPEGHWIKSGWKIMDNHDLYFVELISDEKPERFFKFVFFYLDDKLCFSVLQCPTVELQYCQYLRAAEKYLSF